MRKALDLAYMAGLWAACALMVLTALLVLVQVGGRLIDRVAMALGATPLGIAVPSLAELGGFLLVGASCLALASTLQSGGHVRVTMVAQALPAVLGRIVSLFALSVAAGLAIWATWHSGLLALDSWQFNSLSFGIIKVPLWLPQGIMTLGIGLMAVALMDALVTLARGGTPAIFLAEAASSGEGE